MASAANALFGSEQTFIQDVESIRELLMPPRRDSKFREISQKVKLLLQSEIVKANEMMQKHLHFVQEGIRTLGIEKQQGTPFTKLNRGSRTAMIVRLEKVQQCFIERSPKIDIDAAISSCDIRKLTELSKELHVPIDFFKSTDKFVKRNALHVAIAKGSMQKVRTLLELKCDVNFRSIYPPLFYACAEGDTKRRDEMLDLLLARNAQVLLRTSDFNWNIAYIADRCSMELFQKLLRANLDLSLAYDNDISTSALGRMCERSLNVNHVKMSVYYGLRLHPGEQISEQFKLIVETAMAQYTSLCGKDVEEQNNMKQWVNLTDANASPLASILPGLATVLLEMVQYYAWEPENDFRVRMGDRCVEADKKAEASQVPTLPAGNAEDVDLPFG